MTLVFKKPTKKLVSRISGRLTDSCMAKLAGPNDSISFKEYANRNLSKILVAFDGTDLIGMANFSKVFFNYDIGVWVDPDFRCKGYGGQIIKFLIDKFPENTINAGCWADNLACQHLLIKNGFKQVNRYNGFSYFEKKYKSCIQFERKLQKDLTKSK